MPDQLEDIELRSEEVQEILTKVPHWMIRWGSTLFLSLIVMILALSWIIKYPDIITSTVIVTTEIPPQREYARITGDIQNIFVNDGEEVVKNQPLAILENTADYKDIFYLKQLIDTIQIRSKFFEFPVDDIPILILGDIDIQYALFENSYIRYQLDKQLQPFSNQAQAGRVTLSELQGRLRNMEFQKNLNENELKIAQRNEKRYKDLFEKGSVAEVEYERERSNLLQAERNFENMDIQISQLKEAISTAGSSSKGIEIDRIRQEKTAFKEVIQAFNQLKKSIEDWELQYLLQSSMDGKVSFLNNWVENQSVNAQDHLFTIVPSENSNYVAQLKAPARNSGKIEIGQQVNIKLENYPNIEYGVLEGQVQSISLIPDVDGNYLIKVSLPEDLTTSYNIKIDFKQEMQGTAEIITEDLRLLDRLFYQFKEIIDRE